MNQFCNLKYQFKSTVFNFLFWCFRESEDTMLLILKEIYSKMGIATDSQIPQQTMTIERPPPSPNTSRKENYSVPKV